MNKLDKIPTIKENPQANHENIQVLRHKINEIISFLNKEDNITSKTKEEQIQELKDDIQEAINNNGYHVLESLAQQLKALENK